MHDGRPLIRVEDVSFAYPAAGSDEEPPLALDGVSLELHRGEFVGLVGQNGSGKTTLARHLNGLLKPASGRVLVGELDTRGVEAGRLAAKVGYVFQNPDHALFLPTVRREIEYGLGFLHIRDDERAARVAIALERFGLAPLAERHPASFGRGLRRLVVLAAVYAMAPDVFVLDEPTGGLDARLTAGLMSTLTQLVQEGRTILLITHDMQLVAEHSRRVLVLHEGALVADERPDALFADRALLERIAIQAPQIARLAARLEARGLSPGITRAWDLVDALERIDGRHIGEAHR
jgi:energy-coupling factor transport system ATP-binding protein